VQAAVWWLTAVSLQTVVAVVFVFQGRYSTCRAGNITNILTIINGKASDGILLCLQTNRRVSKVGNLFFLAKTII